MISMKAEELLIMSVAWHYKEQSKTNRLYQNVVRLQNYKCLANRNQRPERARDIGDDGDRRDETERTERRRDQRQQRDQVARPDGETETTATRRTEQRQQRDQLARPDGETRRSNGMDVWGRDDRMNLDETERQI
ncbi:hypothetical protein Scep_011637 [Stephania cephalantha]|uniref:Uncharacterized protein n=1 Tax=Stephania cephalantha TaxID=152367 RepID=A0AAP0JDR1_9MAGN